MEASKVGSIELKVSEGIGELIIRHGEAAPVIEPEQLTAEGFIDSPGRYLEKMKPLINKDKALVIVNKKKGYIKFDTDPRNVKADVICGIIKPNQDLLKFKINEQKLYSQKELIQLIRMNRIFFASREQHTKLVEQLSNLSFSQSISGQNADDRRGNKVNNLSKSASVNIELGFTLDIPIYEGFQPAVFRVDILLDVTDAETKFWLESVELEELKVSLINESIDKEIKDFSEFVVIETA